MCVSPPMQSVFFLLELLRIRFSSFFNNFIFFLSKQFLNKILSKNKSTMDKSSTINNNNNNNNNTNITSLKTISFADNSSKLKHSIETNGTSCLVYGSIGQHKNGSCRVKMRKVIGTNSEVANLPGRLIVVHMNKTHIAYTIQVVRPTGIEGMVRVFNAQTGFRDLIKGSERVILDLQFAHVADNILLAMIEETSLSVYKIEDLPMLNKLSSVLVLKIVDPIPGYKPKYDLISWCPYMRETDNEIDMYAARQLVWVRGGLYQCVSVLSVIETYGTGTHDMDKIKDSTIVHSEPSFITCATFSPDGTTLGISSTDGTIRFYQTYFHANDRMPRCLHEWTPHDGKPITNFFFLDDLTQYSSASENSLWKHVVTTADNNAELKIWCCATWACLQTISFQSNSPNMELFFRIGIDRTSSYIVLSDIKNRGLYVLQIIVDNDQEALQRFLTFNQHISFNKTLKVRSNSSNDGGDDNNNANDDDVDDDDDDVNNKKSGINGDGDVDNRDENKNNDSGTSGTSDSDINLKSIAYVKSIAEFPLALPMMGLAINGAAVRKYKCSNDAYFLNEMDDYDEVNQLLYCVVVDMFSVIPNSVEEISLLYQPTLPQTIELASSASDDSTKTYSNNLTEITAQPISVKDKPVKTVLVKKSIVNTLKDANLLKITPFKSGKNLILPSTPPPPPPPPPPTTTTQPTSASTTLSSSTSSSLLTAFHNAELLENLKRKNAVAATAAIPPPTTTTTTVITETATTTTSATVSAITTTTTTTTTTATTEIVTKETESNLNVKKRSPENNGVSKEVYETLFLLAQNQKHSIASTAVTLNALTTLTDNNITVMSKPTITATTTSKIESSAVPASAEASAIITNNNNNNNNNSGDLLNGLSDDKGQNLLSFVNKMQQTISNISDGTSISSLYNSITSGPRGSGIGIMSKNAVTMEPNKSKLTAVAAAKKATPTTTTTTTTTNRQTKKSKKSDNNSEVQQNTAETSGGSSPSLEVQKILSSKDELNDFIFEDGSIDANCMNFNPYKKTVIYDTETGLPDIYNESNYFAVDMERWDSPIGSSVAGGIHRMKNPIKTLKPKLDDNAESFDAPLPTIENNKQNFPINPFDQINSKLDFLLVSIGTLKSQVESVTRLRDDIKEIKQSRKSDIKELCKTIVKGIKPNDTKSDVVIENSLKQFQSEIRKEFNEMKQIRYEKDKEFHASIIRDITNIINDHAMGNTHLTSTIDQELKPIIVECVQDSVKDAMKNVSNEIASSCEIQLKNKITTLCTSKDFVDKMSNSISATVSLKLEDTYKEIVRTKVLPAYDQSTKQLFSQVNETFMKATGAYIQGFDRYLTQYKPLTEEINTKLTNMPSEMKLINETSMKMMAQKLTKDLANDLKAIHTQMLKIIREHIKREITTCFVTQTATIEGSVLSAVTKAQTPAPNLYDVQEQIKGSLSEGNINSAFHIALLANELNLVEYTLLKADYSKVFNPCVLEQTVLLSLIQQISSDILLNHTDIKQKYLIDSLLNLDLKHPIIKDHIPEILKELHKNCQQYLTSYKTNPLCSGVRMLLIAIQGLGYQF